MDQPFQFSTRMLLAVTAASAVAVAALSAQPSVRSALSILILLFLSTSLLIVGAWSTRGPLRTFFIGALLPCLVSTPFSAALYFSVLVDELSGSSFLAVSVEFVGYVRTPVGVFWGLAVTVGLLSALVHWLISLNQPPEANN
jgi:hypothetical protein